jgi:hypothetical protein
LHFFTIFIKNLDSPVKSPILGQKLGPKGKLFRFFDHFRIRTRSPLRTRHIGDFCDFDPEISPICRVRRAEGVKKRSKNRNQTPFYAKIKGKMTQKTGPKRKSACFWILWFFRKLVDFGVDFGSIFKHHFFAFFRKKSSFLRFFSILFKI